MTTLRAQLRDMFELGYDYHNGRVIFGWGYAVLLAGALCALCTGCTVDAPQVDTACPLTVERNADALFIDGGYDRPVEVTATYTITAAEPSPAGAGSPTVWSPWNGAAYWTYGGQEGREWTLHVIADRPVHVYPVPPSPVRLQWVGRCL